MKSTLLIVDNDVNFLVINCILSSQQKEWSDCFSFSVCLFVWMNGDKRAFIYDDNLYWDTWFCCTFYLMMNLNEFKNTTISIFISNWRQSKAFSDFIRHNSIKKCFLIINTRSTSIRRYAHEKKMCTKR